jgi:HJR/Mrr/RecB family endonuclease
MYKYRNQITKTYFLNRMLILKTILFYNLATSTTSTRTTSSTSASMYFHRKNDMKTVAIQLLKVFRNVFTSATQKLVVRKG